jgi:exocyst complex component 6
MKRPQFTAENIDQQLQQIHLLDASSSSENLEQLGPLIKQIHANRQQEVFLRSIQELIESKDAEIEKICSDSYQDFISSVSTLFSIKSYTSKLKEKITTLDASVTQVGRGLVEKKRALLQSKKTAANLDEAIDTLQACLRVLDVVNRVGEMVREGKYWSALRVRLSTPFIFAIYSIAVYISIFWISRWKTSKTCPLLRCLKHRSFSTFCHLCPLYAFRSRTPSLPR